MKRVLFVAIAFALAAVLLELGSSAALFRIYAAKESAFVPTGLSTVYLAKRAFRAWPFEVTQSVDVAPLYAADDELGFTTVPGRYRIGLETGSKTHSFTWTVVKRGTRATSYAETSRPRSMVVFGDSNVLGWGNNDEHTMPWLLQARFPDYSVLNLALTGYGTTHAVIQYRAIADRLGPDDVVILPYAEYYLPRNYGAPSWMRTLSSGLESRISGKERFARAVYPVVRPSKDGALSIERIPMSCESNEAYCRQADPARSDMVEATKAIVRFFRDSPAKVVLAFLEGADGDPVVQYARQLGLRVIDIRLDKRTPEWDEFGQFDAHAGPTAHFNWFRKLSEGLVANGIAGPLGVTSSGSGR